MRALRFNTQSLPQLVEWIGFENTFNELQRMMERTAKTVKYPPYNVKRVGDNHYVVEMALAGFTKSDIDIVIEGNQLTICGETKDNSVDEYIVKGIAQRSFKHSFTLADSVMVKTASLVNGMLKVQLEQFIPEEKKPKKIEVLESEVPDLMTLKPELLTEGQ